MGSRDAERLPRRLPGMTVLALAVLSALAPAPSAASTAPLRLRGAGISGPHVAFDSHGSPWLAWSAGGEPGVPSGLYVGHLMPNGTVRTLYRVPGSAGVQFQDEAFAITSSGRAVLVWNHRSSFAFGNERTSVATWHLGARPSRPVQLLGQETQDELDAPSIAANQDGLAVVLFGGLDFPHGAEHEQRIGQLWTALIDGRGRLVQRQLAVVAGTPQQPNVSALGANAFQANWGVETEMSGDIYTQAGADTSQSTSGGSFSQPQLTPWPLQLTNEVNSRAPHLLTGDDGDQVLWWTRGSEELTSPQQIFISSRRAGGSFRAPQAIGSTVWGGDVAGPGEVAATISPAGRITLAWKQLGETGTARIETAVGHAGGPIGQASPLTAPSSILDTPKLVAGPRERAIAAWSIGSHGSEEVFQSAISRGEGFTRPRTLFGAPCSQEGIWPSSKGLLATSTCEIRGRTYLRTAYVAWR